MIEKQKKAIRAALFSIAGNTFLALAKGITGIVGNSTALMADAIESASDVFASMLVLFGIRYSAKPPDANHPYGHGKAEPLATFAVVGILVISATIIAYESISNLMSPQQAPESFTLIVLGAIIVIKELAYRFVSKKGKETESTSLKADAWHHRSDAITSLAAFIGISIAVFMGEGYEKADDWAALAACPIILFNAFLIFRPALSEIMDEDTYDDLTAKIREIAAGVEGVSGTEKCMVRKTGMTYQVDLHLLVSGNISVDEGHRIAHNVKDKIQEKLPQIADIHIHVEPAGN